MKRTQRKDAIRNIWKKKVSWISMIIVIILSVGVFLGVRLFSTSMKEDGDAYLRKYNLEDLTVISKTGLLPKELDTIRSVEGVRDVEGFHLLDVTAEIAGKNTTVSLMRRTERISLPELVEGNLPEKEGELAVSAVLATAQKIRLGDTIKLSAGGDSAKLLKVNSFTVTAIINHPEFLQINSANFVLAADPSFDTESLDGGYLRAIILVDQPEDTDIFTDKYFDTILPVEQRIEALFPDMVVSHEQDLRDAAEARIQEETSGPRKKLEDAEQELKDGQKKFDEGEKKLQDAKEELERTEQELSDGEQKLRDGKAQLDKAEQEITENEQKLKDGRATYEKKKADAEAQLAEAKKKLEASEKEVTEGLTQLSDVEKLLSDMAADLFSKERTAELTEEYRRLKEKSEEYYAPAMETAVQQKDNAKLLEDAQNKVNAMVKESFTKNTDLSEAWTASTMEVKELITLLPEQYFNMTGKATAAAKALSDAKKKLAAKEKEAAEELKKAEDQLNDGEKQLEEGKKKYEDGKAEYEASLKKYEDGKEKYETGKADYEKGLLELEENRQKLEDGRKKLEDGKKELEEKIAEARSKIDEMVDGSFALQNRRANNGYVQLRTTIQTISAASGIFVLLFLVICAMVTFSTIVIIVDEQRTLAGGMKALGFFNSAIRAKYLVYGLSAVVVGSLLGIGAAIGVEQFFRYAVNVMFTFGRPGFIFRVIPLLLVILGVLIVVITATWLACRGMLKMSAIQLMNGITKQKQIRREAKTKRGGLYRRLIFRNMRTELPRVIITIWIIAVSCGLIGVGFTLKYAFSGMIELQLSEVQGYDLRVTYESDLSDDKLENMKQILTDAGTSYTTAMEQGSIYRNGDMQEYTYILVLDQSSVGTYYHVRDAETGEEMTLPEDGGLIMNRLSETQRLKKGDQYMIYDTKLRPHPLVVQGIYTNHVGRTVIMSREGYYTLFGTPAKDNLFMIRLNGADQQQLIDKLTAVDPGIIIDDAEGLRDNFRSLKDSYDSVVILLTGFAMLMSVFILTNLVNIFISKRWKELIIMRVNGFSTGKCIGYLIRETLLTTLAGMAIAIILGGIISRGVVGMIEQPDSMMDRSFMTLGWIWAVLLEGIFAFCINYNAFRKIRKLKPMDINK